MRRVKKHKVKQEQPEASSATHKDVERDLTYYIHDRVELMQHVFSVLKPKELKAMAPQCVQYISISDLQELCTEEVLGISSKRLCAILDGAEPPSDTDSSSTSSSPEKLETISLDSISSDEEILSEGNSKKKKHRHRRRKSKTKHKPNSSSENSDNDRSKANRAGLTVLELLELQARARAIRAQLQQEQIHNVTDLTEASGEQHVSDDEVEIKEEPAEVVEISSEDEKPKVENLQKEIIPPSKNSNQTAVQEGQTVTKRINDLIITVPQAKPTRKIKLNRNKSLTAIQKPTVATNEKSLVPSCVETTNDEVNRDTNTKTIDKANKSQNKSAITHKQTEPSRKAVLKEKQKKKQKKKGKEKTTSKDGSDHDEITLELSDSEKMDLLENFDRKNFDNVSSSCTEDSESSACEDENKTAKTNHSSKIEEFMKNTSDKEVTTLNVTDKNNPIEVKSHIGGSAESKEVVAEKPTELVEVLDNDKEKERPVTLSNNGIDMSTADDITVHNESENLEKTDENSQNCSNEVSPTASGTEKSDVSIKDIENDDAREIETDKYSTDQNVQEVGAESTDITKKVCTNDEPEAQKQINRDLSEGELSDRESSEVEASDVKPEVVCISDDDTATKKVHRKKKKKEKKSKKKRKSKKSPDFREDADQNFFKEPNTAEESIAQPQTGNVTETISLEDEDDVCEILELSSDSSCNEDESAVLSKEPTKQEIEALSAKIDEIEREDVVTEEQIKEHERLEAEKERELSVENISWKDRYLDTKKVKTVLSTSSIFNALRKKNKELKRRLEEAKNEAKSLPEITPSADKTLEEGSIEHYNTLEASTRYVDPIREENELENEVIVTNEAEGQVTKEMKKTAKQLLKMYKKLLKYNDMTRQSNPNKKKKKKQKRNKAEKNNSAVIDNAEKIVS